MVRTFLPQDLATSPNIQEIYDDLAGKILKEIGGLTLSCTYHDRPYLFDSKESIKNFLLANDFDSYLFREISPFWDALFQLHHRCSIANIITRSGCEDNCNFYDRFPPSDYPQEYAELKRHSQESVGSYKKAKIKNINALSGLFSYKKLNSKQRHSILCSMNVPVCPYCNMNYTISYDLDDESRSTADVDHFYLNKSYPEYALCLYNFIPSCPVCNSRFKLANSMSRKTDIYPHVEGYCNHARFEISNIVELILHYTDTAHIQLSYNSNEEPRIEHSENILKNEARYQELHSIAEDLLKKVQIYTEDYENDLYDTFPEIWGKLSIKTLVFGKDLTEEEYSKTSLGKFKMDLLIQLGIFPGD